MGEGCCEIHSRMRLCYFDNIQQHTYWYAIVFEVDSHRHERFVVWGSPRICCEAQCTFVLLQVSQLLFYSIVSSYNYPQHLCNTFPSVGEHLLDIPRDCFS
jgi:hypothetical protein